MIKKLLGIVVLGLLWFNVGVADDHNKDIDIYKTIEILEIQTSLGESYEIHLYNINNFCKVLNYFPITCSYTRNGNKFYINLQDGSFILEGSKSFFSKKVKGIWKNRSEGSSVETFWGTITSTKIKTN